MRIFRILFTLIFIVYPFGIIAKIPLLPSGYSFYFLDIVLIILILYWLLYLNKNRIIKKTFKHSVGTPLAIPILLIIVSMIISIIVSMFNFRAPSVLSVLYLLRFVSYSIIYFIVVWYIRKTKQSIFFLKIMAVSGFAVASSGLTQLLLYPDLGNLFYLGWDRHIGRLFSLFLDPNFTGIILVFVSLLLSTLIINKKYIESKLLSIIMLFIVLFSLSFTFSRSSYLTFIISMIVYLLIAKKKTLLIALLFFFMMIITILVVFSNSSESTNLLRYSTIQLRYQSIITDFPLLFINPISGIGFNRLEEFRLPLLLYQSIPSVIPNHAISGTDSSILLISITTGILGLISFFYLFIKIFYFEYLNNKLSTSKFFKPLIISTTIAIFIHSLFVNSLFYPWILIWLWFLWGIRHGTHNF